MPRSCGLFFFLFEDEVGDGGAGGDFGLMGHSCWDVDDVSGVEDDFFSALDAGAQGFAWAAGAVVGVFSLHVPPVTRVSVPLLMRCSRCWRMFRLSGLCSALG